MFALIENLILYKRSHKAKLRKHLLKFLPVMSKGGFMQTNLSSYKFVIKSTQALLHTCK